MENIIFKIDKLLEKYNYSQRQVALECNIRPTTLKMYVDNTIQRINTKDLESLFNFFHNLDNKIILSDIISTNPHTLSQDLEYINKILRQNEKIDINLIDGFIEHILTIFTTNKNSKSLNILILSAMLNNKEINEKLQYSFNYLSENYKDIKTLHIKKI